MDRNAPFLQKSIREVLGKPPQNTCGSSRLLCEES